MDMLVRVRQGSYSRTSFLHINVEMTQCVVAMSAPPGYDSALFGFAKQWFDDYESNAPQPSKGTTLGSPASTVQLVGARTTCDTCFLLAFSPFLLAMLGNNQLPWLIGIQEKCQSQCLCVFCVFPTNSVNVITRSEQSLLPNSQGLRDITTNSKYPSRLLELCFQHKMMSGWYIWARLSDVKVSKQPN